MDAVPPPFIFKNEENRVRDFSFFLSFPLLSLFSFKPLLSPRNFYTMRFSTSSLIASSLCILAVAASPHPSVAPRTPASPSAVPQALKARSPQPSPTVAKRTVPSSYAQRRKKREMQDQETLESLRFCPAGTNVCPIFSSDIASEERTLKNLTAYECVSFKEDLTSCGGCSSIDKR